MRRYRDWQFNVVGKTTFHSPRRPIHPSNAEALLKAAIAGAGIANITTFIAHDAIQSGLLKVILTEYVSLGPPGWPVYLKRRHLSPRVRAFVDFISTHIPPLPAWDAILP